MKLTLLSLLVFGLVAFTFAAPVMEEEEDEDQAPKSAFVEGPDKPTNEVVKIENNDDGEDTHPLSDEPENEEDYVDNDPAKKAPKKNAKKLGKARRPGCYLICRTVCRRGTCYRCYRRGYQYKCYFYGCYRCHRSCVRTCIG
ncbi:uncharacterized protein LOC110236900 [Exaiptasia diaphana]|uniref:Uncharacterized protein n=1 Tax=Exaiptasia diaphana TaxID=2652724 RepID=A0A913X344_EXADI|nr:uncharacterized protein LOC110236900 [Exaiptasia diaphana]